MKALECRSELLTRLRRGMCSPGEVAEAQRHLAGCPECRVSHLLDVDFEEEGALRPEDDERIGRYAALAAATARKQSKKTSRSLALPRTRRNSVYLAVAAALLLVGAAGATLWDRQVHVPLPKPVELLSAHPTQGSIAETEAPGASAVAKQEPVPSEEAAEATERAPRSGQPLGQTATVASAAGEESAPALFEKANDARRSGNVTRAVVLYRQLQRAFPGSAETHLSRVSTGRLLLDAGSHAQALEQFDAYLKAAGGELRLEALAGRAKALGQLGRLSDEQAALRRLVSEFPGSVQAERARSRLDALR